jgi:hypothetical protein
MRLKFYEHRLELLHIKIIQKLILMENYSTVSNRQIIKDILMDSYLSESFSVNPIARLNRSERKCTQLMRIR